MAVRQAFNAFRIKKLTGERSIKQERLDEIDKELEQVEADVRAEQEEPTRSDEEMTEMEDHVEDLLNEKKSLEEAISKIDQDIKAQQDEIEEANINHQAVEEEPQERGVKMNKDTSVIRSGFFAGHQRSNIDGMLEREEVKDFIVRLKDAVADKRTVTGADLGIPAVVLPLIQEKIEQSSKLMKHVNVRRVRGEARVPVMGTVPEAIWIETCSNINELSLAFNMVTLNGYSVAGYLDICRANLEDSDFLTAEFLFSVLSQSVAIAIDKAILYGTGVNMPLGIVTRLAQESQPSGYSPTAPAWVDLSTSNIVSTTSGAEGAAFYSELMGFAALAKGKKSNGGKFWAMNETTYLAIQQQTLSFNANGAIVSAVNNTLPLIGGQVELLNFIPDGDVIGGYGDLYTYVERAGIRLERSDDVKFLSDHALFKAIARGDGMPVIAEGFVLFNIEAGTASTTVTFPADDANAPETP